MDSGTIDEVTEWDSAPVDAGYEGLRELGDREFTGAVTTDGMTWAFVLNGNVIGVFDGTIDAFDDADLSAYVAPDPALPLLFAMREQGGETRAKYYTNDTPLSEADDTLSAGNFTGYVELSENVLSGDYYVVYYGGKSMSAAFVGNSRRLITGDEAFERADDEVGIYEVKEADVDVVEVPDPAEERPTDPDAGASSDADSGSGSDADSGSGSDVDSGSGSDADSDSDSGSDVDSGSGSHIDEAPGTDPTPDAPSGDGSVDEASVADAGPRPTAGGATGSGDGITFDADEPDGNATAEPDATPAQTPPEGRHAAPEERSDSTAATADERTEPAAETEVATEQSAADAASGAAVEETPRHNGEPETRESPADEAASSEPEQERGANPDVFTEEERWRNAEAIPALDPEDTRQVDGGEESGTRPRQSQSRSRSQSQAPSQSRTQSSARTSAAKQSRGRSAGSRQTRAGDRRSASTRQGVDPEVVEKLKRKLEAVREAKQKVESERDELAAERDGLAAERDELTAERDEYRQEAERLAERAESLESKVASLESRLEDAGVTTADRSISPSEALDGTNLFVRYRSKSEGTLEDAHKGHAAPDEVNDNLRLEHHTTFETDGVAVEGRPFEDYLTETVEYGFVRWAVRDLLYEIRETNHRNDLDRLYDAVPQIDRAELNGSVSLKYTEDGEEIREQQSFDVVLRDRMGNPLVVANLNDSRREATEDMMTGLIENASLLRESSDSLAAAFLVTSSFFDPGALEAASDATGGGLLRRSKRKSFVKVSRKRGYHLCLVESRNDEFHVTVPEL